MADGWLWVSTLKATPWSSSKAMTPALSSNTLRHHGAFNRCVASAPAVYVAEYEVAGAIGFDVRTRWSADEARKRYKALFVEKVSKHGLAEIPKPEGPLLADKRDQDPAPRRLTNDEHKANVAKLKQMLKEGK